MLRHKYHISYYFFYFNSLNIKYPLEVSVRMSVSLQVHNVVLHSSHRASDPLVSGQMFASDATVRQAGTNSVWDCPAGC